MLLYMAFVKVDKVYAESMHNVFAISVDLVVFVVRISTFIQRVKGRSPPTVFNTTESEIVSYVPANSLANPIHSGYVEIQLDTAVWVRYWCVIHKNSLYIYANKDSKSTVRTVILPGHEVQALGATSKKAFAIALAHSGLQPVCLAPMDQMDMRKWFMALEHATKTDGAEQSSAGAISSTTSSTQVSAEKVCNCFR